MKPMTILITEAGNAFGRAAAEALSDAGHRVFAAMRDPSGHDREWANALWAQSMEVVRADMSHAHSVTRGVREVLTKAGSIDVWVNDARAGARESDDETRPRTIDLQELRRSGDVISEALKQGGRGIIVRIVPSREGGVTGRDERPIAATNTATSDADMPGETAGHGIIQVILRADARRASSGGTIRTSPGDGNSLDPATSDPTIVATDRPRALARALCAALDAMSS